MYTVIWKTNSLSAKLHYIAELWSCQHKRISHVHPKKKDIEMNHCLTGLMSLASIMNYVLGKHRKI